MNLTINLKLIFILIMMMQESNTKNKQQDWSVYYLQTLSIYLQYNSKYFHLNPAVQILTELVSMSVIQIHICNFEFDSSNNK